MIEITQYQAFDGLTMETCKDCKYYRPVVIEAANVTFHTCPKMGYIFDDPNIVKCKNYAQKENKNESK